MEALPSDIRNLPRYSVPKELFICTCIILIFFLVWTLAMFILWAWRSRRHIHNYEYIADHNIRREFEHAKKTIKEKMEREREEENEVFHSEASETNQTRYVHLFLFSPRSFKQIKSFTIARSHGSWSSRAFQ